MNTLRRFLTVAMLGLGLLAGVGTTATAAAAQPVAAEDAAQETTIILVFDAQGNLVAIIVIQSAAAVAV